MTTNCTPDAARSPLSYAGDGDSFSKMSRLQAEFSRALNVTRVFVRHQGVEHFVTGKPEDTLNVPAHDPRAGAPRYRWEDRGDGVLYGYIHDEG